MSIQIKEYKLMNIKLFLSTILFILSGCGGGGNGNSDATNEQNQAPTATAQSISTNKNTSNNIITLSGTDADNDSLSYSITTQPSNGTLSGTAPNVTYTPVVNFVGSDSFSFKVNDGTEDSVKAIVTITVSDVTEPTTTINQAPIAKAQSVLIQQSLSAEQMQTMIP